MAVSIISPPASLPVTLVEIKQHLRIDHAHEDELLLNLAGSAVEYVETYIRQALIHRVMRQYCDDFPATNRISLEGWPVANIISVTGFNALGEMVGIDPLHYRLVRDELSAELVFRPDTDRASFINGFEIDFTTGFGETGVDVPSNIIQAIKRIIAHWYEVRGSGQEGITNSLPDGIERLLAPVRRLSL